MAEELTESDIRPKALFDRYLSLVAKDAIAFFADSKREDLKCPVCDLTGDLAFTKLNFEYRECGQCRSLWVSPRPAFAEFSAFYERSDSAEYWAEVFAPAVMEVRRERLWRPKARRIADLAGQLRAGMTRFRNVVDIGGGNGVFAEEFAAISDCQVTVVEPSPAAAASCRERGVMVVEAFLEALTPDQLPSGPTLFTSFELFEHVHDPRGWLMSVASLMRPGDVLVLTTLSGTGLDIRVLWEQSASVNPPHHINFLNPSAMGKLARKCGLEDVDVFTPGELDIDILRNNIGMIKDEFWRVVADSPYDERARWQQFIVSMGLSSHMWAVLRKPEKS